MQRYRTLAFAGVLLLGSSATVAQQITVLSPEIHLYNSPLVFMYSLDETLKTFEPTKTNSFAMYSCRGLTIERLELQRVLFNQDKFLSLKVAISMNNNSGKDKKATVVFNVIEADSEKVLASATLKNAKVPTGETPTSELRIPMPTEGVLNHHGRLWITLTVTDY